MRKVRYSIEQFRKQLNDNKKKRSFTDSGAAQPTKTQVENQTDQNCARKKQRQMKKLTQKQKQQQQQQQFVALSPSNISQHLSTIDVSTGCEPRGIFTHGKRSSTFKRLHSGASQQHTARKPLAAKLLSRATGNDEPLSRETSRLRALCGERFGAMHMVCGGLRQRNNALRTLLERAAQHANALAQSAAQLKRDTQSLCTPYARWHSRQRKRFAGQPLIDN